MMRRMAERAGKDVVVREAFRQYLESSREFILAAEGFALKGWPDRKVALHNTFRLQLLFHDREALRFDHLTVGLGPEDVLWKSLSSMSNIFQRIDALWNDCLLYTSDAADDLLCVDLGGRRIIKK